MRTIFTTYDNPILKETTFNIAQSICDKMNFRQEQLKETSYKLIDEVIEEKDGAIVIIGISSNRSIQKYLNIFRQIRIPYMFVKEGQNFEIKEIILPITNLLEEKEKGPFTSTFARFFNSSIKIYQPNDYGSRAKNNIDAITTLLDSFSLNYRIEQGNKNSSAIEFEAIQKENNGRYKLGIVTASREYGLDDIVFGPKERKIIKIATMPVMLINPRGDLYALCE